MHCFREESHETVDAISSINGYIYSKMHISTFFMVKNRPFTTRPPLKNGYSFSTLRINSQICWCARAELKQTLAHAHVFRTWHGFSPKESLARVVLRGSKGQVLRKRIDCIKPDHVIQILGSAHSIRLVSSGLRGVQILSPILKK